MEHLFDGIGGFNSWGFAAIAFGGIVLGLILVAAFRYWGIVGIAGGLPLFAYLSAEASQAGAATSDPVVVATLPITPLIWAVIWIVVVISVAGRTGIARDADGKGKKQ